MFTHSIMRLPVTIGHIGAVSLLLTTRLGHILLKVFAATGKMPLTTYMGASIIGGVVYCGSACKKDPLSGVIGVQKGPLISMS